jgi:hypothetical protein
MEETARHDPICVCGDKGRAHSCGTGGKRLTSRFCIGLLMRFGGRLLLGLNWWLEETSDDD